jgi:hypothetical protein
MKQKNKARLATLGMIVVGILFVAIIMAVVMDIS